MLSSWAEYIAGVGASTVTLAVLVLVLMALAHLSLRWWIKRRARADDDAAGETPTSDLSLRRWVTRGLREVLPALALLIWIHGLSLALNLLIALSGYGSPEHLAALREHGPCPLHRRSFSPVAQADLFAA